MGDRYFQASLTIEDKAVCLSGQEWGLEDQQKGPCKHRKRNQRHWSPWVRGWHLGASKPKVLGFIPLLNQMGPLDSRTQSTLRSFDQLSSSGEKVSFVPIF